MKNRIMIREPTEKILKHIEHKVREGERVLNDPYLRKQIETSLETTLRVSNNNLTTREFMIEITLALLASLRDAFRLGEFDDAVRLLKPLKEIKDIGCSEDFNNIVIVRARPVITDMRSPVDRFLAGLHEYLGRDERAEKKPEEEDSKRRKIWGFAPRPQDPIGGV